jgi:hypothetical protein
MFAALKFGRIRDHYNRQLFLCSALLTLSSFNYGELTHYRSHVPARLPVFRFRQPRIRSDTGNGPIHTPIRRL